MDAPTKAVFVVVHAATGLLFLLLNAILYWALLPGHWMIALAYDPLFAFCCWGWYAEARAIWRGDGLLS
jgi:hypothetical protein